jgi:hypothetical protein
MLVSVGCRWVQGRRLQGDPQCCPQFLRIAGPADSVISLRSCSATSTGSSDDDPFPFFFTAPLIDTGMNPEPLRHETISTVLEDYYSGLRLAQVPSTIQPERTEEAGAIDALRRPALESRAEYVRGLQDAWRSPPALTTPRTGGPHRLTPSNSERPLSLFEPPSTRDAAQPDLGSDTDAFYRKRDLDLQNAWRTPIGRTDPSRVGEVEAQATSPQWRHGA